MRPVRVSENFIPVSELKAQAADWLRKLAETDAPVRASRFEGHRLFPHRVVEGD